MVAIVTGENELRRLFTALTEHTFQVEFGVADPPLTDYLVELLCRFVRFDAIYRFRNANGKRLEEVAEMMIEADEREANPQRELYRHIGDFTLFWSGVYPEALKRLQSANSRDQLLDYCEQGKRSYRIASTFAEAPYEEEAAVLERLSADFELCSFGLNRVRREWERSENYN